jgi:predicted AlkP superfamily pyrophosphatase or phosphodiesterase
MRCGLLLVAVAAFGAASCTESPKAEPRPKLIVQITFDQLRGDLLDRYRPALNGGFRRVMDEGWWVHHADTAHGLTVSYPGHATLATGMTPAHHGLTANEWWQEDKGRWRPVSVVEDKSYTMVGQKEGGVSPLRMTATTLADWVKASSPESEAIVVGSDSAIAYGGQSADAVYWFDSAAGGYATSTFYRGARPQWVDRLNRTLGALPRQWALAVPAKWHRLADHPQKCAPFRPGKAWASSGGRLLGPHRYNPQGADTRDKFLTWVGGTPLADEALLKQVPAIVRNAGLGRDDAVDYLGLPIGATDSVGHEYGAVSLEQLDTIIRLDRALGVMLDGLDKLVGKGRYAVAISADHGVADPPEEQCIRRVTAADIDPLLDRVEAIARAHTGSRDALIAAIVAELRKAPFVGEVYTQARLSARSRDSWQAELMKRSFRPGRTTDYPLWSEKPRPFHPARYGISVEFKRGVVFHYARGVHGSPYAYDRLVPAIFYGAGVAAYNATLGARTVDVAPTLASLAGIAIPPNRDGRALKVKGSR